MDVFGYQPLVHERDEILEFSENLASDIAKIPTCLGTILLN
jgi:hypothetical protein